MTITTRLRKSSSPSRWLMGLPPTSPRFKFVHIHPGGAGNGPTVPRRPPRQPPSPSTRSRSLELLDQQVREATKLPSVTCTVVQRPPLPRPRSRSLDGLLDEDVAKNDSVEPCGEQDQTQNSRGRSIINSREDKVVPAVPASEQNRKQTDGKAIPSNNDPKPLPRTKPRTFDIVEAKSETENERASLDKNENNEEAPPARPPKSNRRSSLEEQFSTNCSKQREDQKPRMDEQGIRETVQERLMTQEENNDYDDDDNESAMMLKASRSCGAGLDTDGSASSSEYSGLGARAKDPGSLLSLPTGAEPKRKRNFMDKCVNKVRSFMKK